MSFTRRFDSQPSQQQISQIEGVVIVDQTPAGSIQGAGSSVVALLAEFPDGRFATALDPATGIFSTKPQPVQVFSSADQIGKTGAFDETIGDTGNSGGSGWVDLIGKTFPQLVIVPINLFSQYGMRVFRQLPTNKGATNPTPIVPLSAAVVPAGTEFKTAADRVRTGRPVNFTNVAAYATGVDGAVTAGGGPAEHQTFVSAGGNFIVRGVKKGDILVLGVLGAGGAQGANAKTYRVGAVTDATHLELEEMDGSNFNTTTGVSLAWRLHVGSTADSYGSGNSIQDASQVGYTVQARPLDATIDPSTVLAPTVAQPTPSATVWAPLSGLAAASGVQPLTYTAAIQAPNAAVAAGLEALYQSALDSLLANKVPANQVSIVVSSRTSSVIRAALKAHCAAVSAAGPGRTSPTSPALNTDNAVSTQSTSNILSDTSPGVGANRDERIDYAWPGWQVFVPSAVGFSMPVADGTTTTDGILDTQAGPWLAMIEANLPPEQDPAQESDTVAALTAAVLGAQRGAPDLQIADYIALKAAGVAAPVHESNGWFFESGVTTSLTSGQTDINRRRFADFVEDSLAQAMKPFIKQNLTDDLKDNEVAQIIAFMEGLLSRDNPIAQRIAAYSVDDQGGNTPALLAQGIYTVLVAVQMLAEQKNLVLVVQVGTNVQVSVQQ